MYNPNLFQWERYENNIYVSKLFTTKDCNSRKYLPKSPGCYAWYFKNSLLYIGTTKNLKQRFGNHLFSKISGPRTNAIYTTTARDTIMRYLYPHINHEKYRPLEVNEKKENEQFNDVWEKLLSLIKNSEYIIYSTKYEHEAKILERELIEELRPKCNNVVPEILERNDKEVLGFEVD